MRFGYFACALGLALACAGAVAQDPGAKQFPPEQVRKGADIYARYCATCHGERLADPPWAVDLRTFPRGERARFIDAVAYGVRNMPQWGDVIKPDEIEALWTYVVTGEQK